MLLAEGLSVFSVEIPRSIAGRSLDNLRIRSLTGCTVIAVDVAGERTMNPGRDFIMPKEGRLLLVGTLEAEDEFLERFRPEAVPIHIREKEATPA